MVITLIIKNVIKLVLQLLRAKLADDQIDKCGLSIHTELYRKEVISVLGTLNLPTR